MLVAFDSQTCIWGIDRPYSDGSDATARAKAKTLVASLTRHRVNILLPSPVVSEILAPLAKAEQHKFFTLLSRKFRIGYYDAKASLMLAEILNHHHYNNGKYKELGIRRTVMKYDAYIIAIAMAYNVECIYSSDHDFKTIAAHFIEVNDSHDKLPTSIIRSPEGTLFNPLTLEQGAS